ncbi:ribonucleotide-diphosphate reductase subunit beta [Humibacter ginsenosidimutans]|uniref:Ribonucleotide-diphosphate reductase subunit beta n=1 Tax=Humibacter ginsenosidimutans TaxID=2599293 RepID=A0A5B8M4T5_9MICO|nr:ribonucleotide-diphosphate reductase subunit beta [Humibacter ginsenosidimutans]
MNEGTQNDLQLVGDYFVPEDPMEAFQCESCQ